MYRLTTPHSTLQPYIEHYWHVQASLTRPLELTVDVFVDLRPDLVVNLGAPYHRTRLGGARVELDHSNLDAQRLYPIRIEQRGAAVVTGVRFRTGGLMPFVSHPLKEWTDRVVRLDEAFGVGAHALETTLRDAEDSLDRQREALDDFLLRRLQRTEATELAFRLKSAQEAEGGLLRIEALADLGATTLRTVNRLFRRYIGVGPKAFASVTRFQRALDRIKTDPGVSIGTVAAECGYADHSHFVRQFKRFAGAVPSRQLGYFPPGAPTDFSPNLVRFVQDGAGPGP